MQAAGAKMTFYGQPPEDKPCTDQLLPISPGQLWSPWFSHLRIVKHFLHGLVLGVKDTVQMSVACLLPLSLSQR